MERLLVVREGAVKSCKVTIQQAIYGNTHKKLADFVDEIRVISTIQKWDTWGRTYVEVPAHVLKHFGIETDSPITFYFNYVYCSPCYLLYTGNIFSKDAAWFDYYFEIDSTEKKLNSNSWKLAERAIEKGENVKKIFVENELGEKVLVNDQDFFTNYFHHSHTKWKVVPVNNCPPDGPQGLDEITFDLD
jgi:hypothetical protein